MNDVFLECVFWFGVAVSGLGFVVGSGLAVVHFVCESSDDATAEGAEKRGGKFCYAAFIRRHELEKKGGSNGL